MATDNPQFLLDTLDGKAFLRVSERKFYLLRRDPKFPKPIVLGPRCLRWRRSDLEQYAADMQADRDAIEPPQLSRARRAKSEAAQ